MESMRAAVVTTAAPGKFRQTVRVGTHTLIADEPVAAGGDDAGIAPHEWIFAGLGACTSMTLKAYAERKGWPLEEVEVTVHGEQDGGAFVLSRAIRVKGNLTPEQHARLLEIAEKCPVHKSLTGPIRIESTISPAT